MTEWTPDLEAEVRTMRPAHSYSQIAAKIGMTKSAVISKARRIGIDFVANPVVKKPIPQETADQLRDLSRRGLSDQQIASIMNKNDSTIFVWRKKLGIGKPPVRKSIAAIKSDRIAHPPERPRPSRPALMCETHPSRTCEWPLNDCRPWRFCDAPAAVIPGRPRNVWCPVHYPQVVA